MKKEMLNQLIKSLGRKFSDELEINLKSADDKEIFKWFLASILFGAPIRESSAIKTYKCFKKYGILTSQKIIQTGWQGLVDILDEGTYTRYDFRTSDKLLEVMAKLITRYDGSLNLLQSKASDTRDLENRLKDLGKGIGEVTVSIFLRELRDIWEKAKPNPTSLVISAAKNLGIVKDETSKNALEQLEGFWVKNKVAGKSFISFETALLRLGKDFCRKGKCVSCPVKSDCLNPNVP